MHADDRVAPGFFAIPWAILILLTVPSMIHDLQFEDVPAADQFCTLRAWIILKRSKPGSARRLIAISQKTIRLPRLDR